MSENVAVGKLVILVHTSSEETQVASTATIEGAYYVSATRDGDPQRRYVALAGPYDTHEAALAAVPEATRRAHEVDPRAPWYAYGTCRTDSAPKTAFGVL